MEEVFFSSCSRCVLFEGVIILLIFLPIEMNINHEYFLCLVHIWLAIASGPLVFDDFFFLTFISINKTIFLECHLIALN